MSENCFGIAALEYKFNTLLAHARYSLLAAASRRVRTHSDSISSTAVAYSRKLASGAGQRRSTWGGDRRIGNESAPCSVALVAGNPGWTGSSCNGGEHHHHRRRTDPTDLVISQSVFRTWVPSGAEISTLLPSQITSPHADATKPLFNGLGMELDLPFPEPPF
jgi:hypothetical protein